MATQLQLGDLTVDLVYPPGGRVRIAVPRRNDRTHHQGVRRRKAPVDSRATAQAARAGTRDEPGIPGPGKPLRLPRASCSTRLTDSRGLCDRWSSGGPAEETAEWMSVTRARSASQPGAGADSSTPNPGKPFGRRSPLYRCWPHRLSTSGGNDAGVLRKLGPQKPKAPPVATLFLRWSSAAPAVSHSRRLAELVLVREDAGGPGP